MAIVPDKSGNSPIGYGVDPHIQSPSQNSNDIVVDRLTEIDTELQAQTAILADIETNTTPTP